MSTFHGLEMAKQALFAQQAALYTTGHNLSNANTEGYTRQRVNFETMSPYPAPGRNRPELPGQMGTGVQIGSIQRIRDKFLDYQFRAETSRAGYWNTKSQALSRMENLLNEPSDSGLSKTMNQFWQSLQDLAVNPENSGARSVVAHRGKAVAETFNHLSETLHSIRDDLKSQIDHTIEDANSLLRQINRINEQIKKIEPHGYLTNDLYDERDRLIDELSQIMNIKVTYDKSHDSALDIADGVATIEVVDSKGSSLDPKIVLIDGKKDYDEGYFKELLSVEYDENNGEAVKSILINGNIGLSVPIESIGSLAGLIDAYGYVDNNNKVIGEYPHMIEQLDKMAFEFVKAFNAVHKNGFDLNGDPGIEFFSELSTVDGAAGNITINDDIIENPNLIAASSKEVSGENPPVEGSASGNGKNALELAKVFNSATLKDSDGNPILDSEGNPIVNLDGKSVNGFFESLIGSLGVKAQEAKRMIGNTEVLRSQVQDQRMSVSAVSLDEEMTNMIKFQHAYNAAARSMTTIDEMLDRIINGMGLVGR